MPFKMMGRVREDPTRRDRGEVNTRKMRKYALMTLAMLAMVVALAVMGCGQKAEEAAPPADQTTAPMDTTAMPMDTTAAPADTMAH